MHRLESIGSMAVVHRLSCNTWNLPKPGIEPVSLALAGGFLSIVPAGKSHMGVFVY